MIIDGGGNIGCAAIYYAKKYPEAHIYSLEPDKENFQLIKLDIEGAEKEVFGAPDVDEWLSKVNVLVIELHDRMKRGCSYEFFKAISKYHWFHAYRGENIILIRESLMN